MAAREDIWTAALGGSGRGERPTFPRVRHGRDAGGAASASGIHSGGQDESVMAGSSYLHDAAVGAVLSEGDTMTKVVTAHSTSPSMA